MEDKIEELGTSRQAAQGRGNSEVPARSGPIPLLLEEPLAGSLHNGAGKVRAPCWS